MEKAREASLEQFTIDAELRLADAWDRAEERTLALDALDRAVQRRGSLPALVQAAIEIELAPRRRCGKEDSRMERRRACRPVEHP